MSAARPHPSRKRLWILGGVALAVLILIGGGVALAIANANASGTTSTPTVQLGGTSSPSTRQTRATYTVTGVSGNTISATTPSGAGVTILVSNRTKILRGGLPATLADIVAGMHIQVTGQNNGSGTITAARITIVLPGVAGDVTAISGDTLTVQGAIATRTVVVSSTTKKFWMRRPMPRSR